MIDCEQFIYAFTLYEGHFTDSRVGAKIATGCEETFTCTRAPLMLMVHIVGISSHETLIKVWLSALIPAHISA